MGLANMFPALGGDKAKLYRLAKRGDHGGVLAYFSEHSDAEIVDALLFADSKGNTAVEIAYKKGNYGTAALIVGAGALLASDESSNDTTTSANTNTTTSTSTSTTSRTRSNSTKTPATNSNPPANTSTESGTSADPTTTPSNQADEKSDSDGFVALVTAAIIVMVLFTYWHYILWIAIIALLMYKASQ
ncbi:Aste57867_9328 [Aphanomyces stellatus]|uniref:Aste57867_9328 protein n=1 Tax=Aphanomyces stellatus TaxID=120398 RepID=A0A485KMX4_9STRA|nr:hypothetical protein As57867_009292 [Aphanomyces stellatus]VFT86210.1 Aste57867_9328 [Aphanomyces stellatus]